MNRNSGYIPGIPSMHAMGYIVFFFLCVCVSLNNFCIFSIFLKQLVFLCIEQTQLLDVLMLFYAITYVRRPQIISFDTMAVPLDSCIVGLWHQKKLQEICL